MDRHWAKVPTVGLGISTVTEGASRRGANATRLGAVAGPVRNSVWARRLNAKGE